MMSLITTASAKTAVTTYLDQLVLPADTTPTTDGSSFFANSFDGPAVLSLSAFVHRTFTYSRAPVECLVAAAALCDRICTHTEQTTKTAKPTLGQLQRLYTTCTMFATKLYSDDYQSVKFYAFVGGVGPRDLLQMERVVLQALGERLLVTVPEFNRVLRSECTTAALNADDDAAIAIASVNSTATAANVSPIPSQPLSPNTAGLHFPATTTTANPSRFCFSNNNNSFPLQRCGSDSVLSPSSATVHATTTTTMMMNTAAAGELGFPIPVATNKASLPSSSNGASPFSFTENSLSRVDSLCPGWAEY
jgi:hypothetical protein